MNIKRISQLSKRIGEIDEVLNTVFNQNTTRVSICVYERVSNLYDCERNERNALRSFFSKKKPIVTNDKENNLYLCSSISEIFFNNLQSSLLESKKELELELRSSFS